MNDENRERLSALVDGELHGEALEGALDTLGNDPELQSSWRAYHLVRDTVSSNLDHSVAPQLYQRVASALASEPTILAPPRRERPWLKHVAGVAIAASVTGVAIIGVQSMNVAGPATTAPQVAQKQEYLRMAPTRLAEANKEKPRPGGEALTPYLVNHNEYSANSGIQGMLPYVRIVGHKVGK